MEAKTLGSPKLARPLTRINYIETLRETASPSKGGRRKAMGLQPKRAMIARLPREKDLEGGPSQGALRGAFLC